MYYTQEEDLRRDAKRTELEFASARVLASKLKSAYINGKIPILRIIFGVAAVLGLLLPTFNLTLSFPWWEYKISVGALGVYKLISDSFLDVFSSFGSVGVAHELYVTVIASFVLLFLTALSMLVCAVLLLLSFVNIRKTAKMTCVVSGCGVVFSLVGTVMSVVAANICSGFEFIEVKLLFGGILVAVLLGMYFSVNLVLAVNPPEIFISEADRERLEIKRKLKSGEITLDDLPLPVIKEEKKERTDKKERKKEGKKK